MFCPREIEPSSPLNTSVLQATGLQPDDLDENNVFHIRRVVYEGEVEVLEKEQLLPLDSVVHADLIRRIRALGVGRKWVFQSRAGTTINSGNVRRRFPASGSGSGWSENWRLARLPPHPHAYDATCERECGGGEWHARPQEGGTGGRSVRPRQQHRHRAGALT
jgi:hypothetical protein